MQAPDSAEKPLEAVGDIRTLLPCERSVRHADDRVVGEDILGHWLPGIWVLQICQTIELCQQVFDLGGNFWTLGPLHAFEC